MQVQLEIGFDQLVELARNLPTRKWNQLKNKVENKSNQNSKNDTLESILLNAPTFSKKQIETIEEARKSINQWRRK